MDVVCTLTWHEEPGGYAVFFNRDERNTRKPAEPPAVRHRGDIRFLAPLDGDYGGTWIAVNEAGLSLCLLNGFPAGILDAADERDDVLTRGRLPLSLIDCPTSDRVAGRLPGLDLARFRPFVLVAFDAEAGGLVADWSGRALKVTSGRANRPILVSSSFLTEEVRTSRIAVFEEMVGGVRGERRDRAHLDYHRSHRPARGPYSPCMHRDEASTVSFTVIRVDAGHVRMAYAPHSPCRGMPGEPPLTLERPVRAERT